jgi:apolipoprotein N-acyltransferase
MTAKESFYSGMTAGICHFLSLIYWIVPTVHVYGGLHPVLAVSTLMLLCIYLALYPAVFAFLVKKTPVPAWLSPLLAACLWTGLEYIRTYAFTGFAWGALGYSQHSNLMFIQIADISGVYGVSFLIVLGNYLLTCLWVKRKALFQKNQLLPLGYTLILFACTLFYGHHRILNLQEQIHTASKPMISVVQGNIKQDQKWSDAFKSQTIDKYIRLSRDIVSTPPELVIWPETAIPFFYGHDQPLSQRVDQCAREAKTNFLIGSPAFLNNEQAIVYYNRVYLLNRFAIVTGTYDKHHLVPFGEYVPFGKYLTFLGKITAQAGNFSKGDTAFAPLDFNTHKTGVLICFEILFPGTASTFVKNGADILTTVTNDAWFGKTSAAEQHFSIAVFRAVENRRSVARAANTGISGFIDPMGNPLEKTALFTDAAVSRPLPALSQISFYTRYGDVFAIISIVAFCLVFVVQVSRRKTV